MDTRGAPRTTPRMRFSRLTLGLAALFAATLLHAAPARAQKPLGIPQPVGYVNDFAGVIDPESKAAIERVVDEVRARSGGEIVVVTLPSLEGRSRDEVALEIGRQWRVGRKGAPGDARRNTGVVVLVAVQDRTYKIETGTGTMTFITAAEAGRIGRDYMLPEFRQERYGRGLLLAVTALAQQYAQSFGFQLTGDVPALPERDRQPQGKASGSGFIFMVVFFLIVMAISSRGGRGGGGGGRRRRGWGGPVILPFPIGGGGGWSGGFGWGGGGGGGFGGFGGGGGFSGGGAGGDW
jgi:uncharacterized protein